MVSADNAKGRQKYRVWLIGFQDWQPERWSDTPLESVALEPAEDAWFTVEEAAVFVRSFNEAMLTHPKQIWAIPVPVAVRYDGDLAAGQAIDGDTIDLTPLRKAAATLPW